MRYADLVIEAFDVPAEPGDDPNSYVFKVRVLASDAGQHSIGQASERSFDRQQLQARINLLSDRGLDRAGLIAFGRELAGWLLPMDAPPGAASVRSLFERSRSLAGQDGGVRLRLQLASADLARIPWEYLYIDPAGGGDQMDGFLALDPRVAIVRHESLSIDVPRIQLPADVPLKVVAALALAADLGQLDLAQERESLGKIFGAKGVAHEFLEQSTIEDILANIHDAHVFHFAGHGEFATTADRPRTYIGTGALALADERVDSEQLSLNLRGNQLRLAVLGACESGKRGGSNVINPWGAIAPMLIKTGVPAVVANQFKIADACAIAFSTAFYQALFGGLSVERAVTAGRLAAYNADKEGRDWGVPVLYMLSEDGQIFAGVADEPARAQAAATAEAIIQQRIEVIANIVRTDGGAAIMAPIESGRDTTINNTVVKEQVASKFVVDKLFLGGAVESDPTPTPPMLPRHYAPRESLEQELRAKLLADDDSAPVTILWGSVGTGKGPLATAVADRLFNHEGHFAGGVLWGDCSSRTVEELLRDFLTALGRRSYDEGAMQRTVTAKQLWQALDERHKQADGDDRRTLVVVDNVRDLSQLKQLLPHSPTRSRLLAISDSALESAELPIGGSCHVGPLEPEQSLYLFRNVLGDELVAKYRDAFVEIGEVYHYLPTLVSAAAQNLAETKANPRTFLRQLQESADGRGTMGEQLIQAQQLVLENLAPLPAELFALTSLFGGGDWPAGMLAAVALRPLSEVQPALDLLVRRELLAPSGGRYRTNTLYRDLARRRFEERMPYEREAACHLLARYCLDMVQNLVLAIESQQNLRPLDRHGRANYEFYGEFRSRLTAEMPHIRQVLDWAARTRSWEIVRRFAYMSYMGLVDPLIWDDGPIYLDLQMTTLHGIVVRPPRQQQPVWYEFLPNGVVGLASGDENTIVPEDEALVKKVKPLLQHPASSTPELYCSLAAGAIVDGAIVKADLIHSAWIGVRAENLILVDVDMVGARFVACELSLCVWRSCNASRAALAGSNLSYAILRQVKLRGADLTGVDLTGVVLDDVDLRDADLRGANLSGAWLRKVNLLGARLENVVWAGVAHEDLVIDGELLDDVLEAMKAAPAPSISQIYGWIPQSRDLSDTICPPNTFRKADLRASNLSHVSFDQSKLRAADMRAAQLDHSTLDRVNLREADLCAASLDETRIDRANLGEARLFAASLAKAWLIGADLNAANLYAACLENALLYDVDLCDANLYAVCLADTTLYRAKLGEANLVHANLAGASLCEVDLSGAVGASDEQLVEQFKQAYRLRGSTMPDGTTYDGRFQLAGDLADAKAQGIDTQDETAMRRFYETRWHQRSLAEIVLQHQVQLVPEAEREHAATVAALAHKLAELASHESSDPSQLLAISEQLDSAATALPALLPYAQQVIGEARKPILAAALQQIDQQIEQDDGLSNREKQQIKELIQQIGKEASRRSTARGARLTDWLKPLARIAPGGLLALAPYLTSPLLVENDVRRHIWVAALFAQIYAYIGQCEETRRVKRTAEAALEKIYSALAGEQIDNELIAGQLLLLYGKAPNILAFALNRLTDSNSPVAPAVNAIVEQLNAGN